MDIFQRRKQQTSPVQVPDVPRNYLGRLGYIGRQLDDSGCRSISILEYSGSFIVRAIDRRSNDVLLTEVVQEDFDQGLPQRSDGPQSGSYEALLRALGNEMDNRVAANVAIIERDESFQTVGWQRGHVADRILYVPFDTDYERRSLGGMTGRLG